MGKVSDLTAASALASGDLVCVVDVSDTAPAHPAGNSTRATLTQLATALATIGAYVTSGDLTSYATDSELAAALAALAPIAASGSASDLTAGTVPTARLGSGTPTASKFLRGDQTWATPTDVSSVGGSLYLFANYY